MVYNNYTKFEKKNEIVSKMNFREKKVYSQTDGHGNSSIVANFVCSVKETICLLFEEDKWDEGGGMVFGSPSKVFFFYLGAPLYFIPSHIKCTVYHFMI